MIFRRVCFCFFSAFVSIVGEGGEVYANEMEWRSSGKLVCCLCPPPFPSLWPTSRHRYSFLSRLFSSLAQQLFLRLYHFCLPSSFSIFHNGGHPAPSRGDIVYGG